MIYLDNSTRPWKETYNLPEVKAIRDKIKDSFKDLVFDEGPHQYYLNGKNVRSVSKTIDLFVVPFDSWGQAQSCYEKYYEDPTSPYYHMTAKEIKKSWDDNNRNANDQGTLAHAFGENAMHYMVGDYDAMDPMFRERIVDGKYYAKDGFEEAIVKFWNDLPDEYVPVMVESRVYATCGTDNPVYAGTFDLLMYSTVPGKEGLVIFDYKTNKDLYKNFKEKKLKLPFEKMLDHPKNHYELQQALYENALNEIGQDVKGKRLIWLKNDGSYTIVRMTEKVIPFLLESLT
jgi:hypothetical protein